MICADEVAPGADRVHQQRPIEANLAVTHADAVDGHGVVEYARVVPGSGKGGVAARVVGPLVEHVGGNAAVESHAWIVVDGVLEVDGHGHARVAVCEDEDHGAVGPLGAIPLLDIPDHGNVNYGGGVVRIAVGIRPKFPGEMTDGLGVYPAFKMC